MKQFLKSYYGITAVLLINLIFYVFIIYKVPWFLSDDFYIFFRVGENLKYGQLFPAPNEVYHLFLRPILYLSFLFDYKFLIENPVLIKISTLFLHLGFLLTLYFLFINFCRIYKIKFSNNLISLLILALSLSPVSYNYIIWISSKNVALLNLFFALSFLFVTKYIFKNKVSYLIWSMIFFSLAALSKQQALIFPVFICIFVISIKNLLPKETLKAFYTFIIVSLFISAIFAITNYVYTPSAHFTYFKLFIYKKPFVLFGALYTVLLPLFYINVYNFFSEHIVITSILALFFISILIYFIIFKKNARRNVFFIIFIWIFSFFPQIIVSNEIRNLSMQLIVLYFILLIILFKYFKKKIILYISVFLVLINFIATVRATNNSVIHHSLNEYEFSSLKSIIKDNPDSNYLVFSLFNSGLNLPYEYYYYKYHSFNKSDISSLHLSWDLKNEDPSKYLINPRHFADIELKGDTLILNSRDDNISIFGNTLGYNIFDIQMNPYKRYKSFKMILPEEYKNKIIIYFDGEKWITLN